MYKLLVSIFGILTILIAQDADSIKAPIKQINEAQYQLDNIFIDVAKREVTLPATVNMQDGLVEVFLCARGGKVHESVFVADVVPYYLQVALILIGLKDGHDALYQKTETQIKGDPLEIWIDWQDGSATKRYHAEELIWNVTESTTMRQTSWVFTGSWLEQGRFMADDVKSLVTTYNDPSTIIDNPLATGQNDEVYRANKKVLPPKGTPVTIMIKAR
jgi:hypothetical protein